MVRTIGLTLAFGYLVILGGTFLQGEFLVDAQGLPIANDFVGLRRGPADPRRRPGGRLRSGHKAGRGQRRRS